MPSPFAPINGSSQDIQMFMQKGLSTQPANHLAQPQLGKHQILVGGFSETYARQIISFPQVSGMKIKNMWSCHHPSFAADFHPATCSFHQHSFHFAGLSYHWSPSSTWVFPMALRCPVGGLGSGMVQKSSYVTSWYGEYQNMSHVSYRVSWIRGGARFLPSTVS